MAVSAALGSSQAAAEVFDDRGFSRNRSFFSQLPFEHIDPLTGNLLLTHTDLVLPGNAGFDLRIQRTYNSKIYLDYNLGQTGLAEDSWAGVGWTLHMGRVFNVLGTDTASPVVEMPDGSRHPMFHRVGGTGDYISRDYWIYDKNARVLKLPNGVTYTFNRTTTIGTTTVAYATEIRDTFGNTITINYLGTPFDAISSIVQNLSTSQQRTVTFDIVSGELRGMRFGSSLWSYTHAPTDASSFSILTAVAPPVGQGWGYDYDTTLPLRWELIKVTTPHGGQIEYTYADFFSRLGSTSAVKFHGVKTRKTLGRDVPVFTWDYNYAQGASLNETVITGPCNVVTMRFLGVGNTTPGAVWRIGLLEQRTVKEGATTLQTEVLAWRTPLSGDRISDDQQTVGFNQDPAIYVPLVAARTATRNGRTYTTTNTYRTTNFNDYGRPWQIAEDGDLDRTTQRVFDYAFGALYIKDRVKSETVTVGSESFTRGFEYADGTGFLTDETVYGILKEYTPTARGNVASFKDQGTSNPSGNITRFPSYSWGQPETIQTPEHTFTRVINADGTIASETRRGLTTDFQYDLLFRPTRTVPPAVANPTITTYDNIGDMESFTVARGSSSTTTDLDGFGRPTATANAVGIKMDIDYDTCGRRAYESYPYSGSETNNIGSTYEYDGLDRITKRKNPAHATLGVTEVTYSYGNGGAHGGIDVSITNERNKTTLQTWQAFGDPGDARLARVQDANNKAWLHSYNGVGSLTGVSDSGGLLREWRYFSASERPSGYGLLKDEKHPENEGRLIAYSYYPNGLVRTRTDALLVATTYEYDGNNRLTKADRPGTVNDTTLGYDASDNRRTLVNGYVSSTFDYDDANRLTSRADGIGGRSFTTGYVPDGNDNVSRIDYHSGLGITYDYDAANRITAVRRTGSGCPGAGCFAHSVAYHPSGGVASFVAGNGGTHVVGYDPRRYWVTSVNAGGHVVLGYQNYDGVGNVGDITDSRTGFDQHFVYDNLDRLTTANGPWGGGAFGFDDFGNRTSKTIGGASTTYTYSAALQRLTSAAGGGQDDAFGYDFNGNLTSQNGGRLYTYTAENMVETARVGGITTTYRYDGDSLRKVRDPGGSKYFYIHGLGAQLLSEYNEPCAGRLDRVRDYVYLGSRLLASVRPTVGPTTVTLTAASHSVTEPTGGVTPTMRVQTGDGQPTACAISVPYATEDGTAAAPADYALTTGAFTLPAGTPSNSDRSVTVPIVNDALDEDNETFSFKLTGVAGAVFGSTTSAAVTIVDDDPLPRVSSSNVSVTEGAPGTQTAAAFTVNLTEPSGRTVTVDFATADVTATAGADYQPTSTSLTFLPGTIQRTVSVVVQGDGLDEYDEQFRAGLSNAQNATIQSEGLGTIVDDDPLPVVSTQEQLQIAEGTRTNPDGTSGTRPQLFRVSLTPVSGREVRVGFLTADGTARGGGIDYLRNPNPFTVVIPPGTTAVDVPVSVVEDRTDEPFAETFFVRLQDEVNATRATPPQPEGWRGQIIDDDNAPTLSVADCTLVEGNAGSASCAFAVSLSNPSYLPVGVDYLTTTPNAMPATPEVDFTTTTGSLAFAAETTSLSQAVNVSVAGDAEPEVNEVYLLRLVNSTNADIADGDAAGTIVDNEASRFYPVTPCRVADTRQPAGPSGGPALPAGQKRSFPIAGRCGVPETANAVALNVTTTAQTSGGGLRVYPAGLAPPPTSTLSFAAGRVRANNATVLLGTSGQATVQCDMPTGQTHVIVDVFGYYSTGAVTPAPGPGASEEGR